MIENTYAEIGTGIGIIVGTIIITVRTMNGKKGPEASNGGTYVKKTELHDNCEKEHRPIHKAFRTNEEEHKKIMETCTDIKVNVARLLERTKK